MITFTFTKQADDPKVTQIQATFTNLSSDTYTDFVFQAAVPKVCSRYLVDQASLGALLFFLGIFLICLFPYLIH